MKATFPIAIKDTALASHAGAFDADVNPVSVELVDHQRVSGFNGLRKYDLLQVRPV